MSPRESFLESIALRLASEKGRVISLLVGAVIAVSGRIVTTLTGAPLTAEEYNLITVIFTLAFGWVIDIWASRYKDRETQANAAGVAKIQEVLQTADPTIKVDGKAGERTIQAAAAVVAATASPTQNP